MKKIIFTSFLALSASHLFAETSKIEVLDSSDGVLRIVRFRGKEALRDCIDYGGSYFAAECRANLTCNLHTDICETYIETAL